jgi:ketosteroid isomerase-like protein
MKKLLLPLCLAAPSTAFAAPCLPTAALIERDAQYEEALRVGDVPFLQALLADDYVWVHTLGSQIETRADILKRSAKPATIYKARTPSEVHAHVQGDTVVLRGLSTVDQWNADGKTFRSNRYQFMRTYVNVGGACKLLSVQTMKVWSSETK